MAGAEQRHLRLGRLLPAQAGGRREPRRAPEQALYPARAGGQATLRITFTAPLDAGTYQSAWQAFNPDGAAFGDAIFMTINVSP